jgi:hypothetical protein
MTGVKEAIRGRRRGVSTSARESAELFLKQRHHGVDIDRLDDDQVRELLDVIDKVKVDGGTNFKRLSRKERRRFEALTERACLLAPGAFQRERDEANLRDKAAALAKRAAQIAAPTPHREQAFIGQLGEGLREGSIDIEDVATLIAVLAALLEGQGLAPYSTVSGGELVVDRRYGVAPASRDEIGVLARWQGNLQWLADAGYLEVERNGANYSIRVGAKTRAALWESS